MSVGVGIKLGHFAGHDESQSLLPGELCLQPERLDGNGQDDEAFAV
jgi:hypothetical protein